MIRDQHRVERDAWSRIRQQRAHRGVREEQFLARIHDRDGVLQLLDRRFQVGHLSGHLRPIRRQLLADRVEERAELAELVFLIHVQLHAEFAFAQAGQPAANHVNRPQEELREQRRDQDRHSQRPQGRHNRRPQRLIQILPNQQRRHANPRRTNLRVAQEQRSAKLEVLPLARIDREQLRQRRLLQQLPEIADRRKRLHLERFVGVCHRDSAVVHQRCVHHVLGIQARLENRTQSRIRPQCRKRFGAADDHLLRAVIDRVGEQLGARAALVEADAREAREVQHAEHHDDRDDDRRDADDLFTFDS